MAYTKSLINKEPYVYRFGGWLMAIGFKARYYWYQIGHGDFLHAFFSTISYHLESDGWGSKYPCLLKNLYYGRLDFEDIPRAREEVIEIRSRLMDYKPSSIIWDIENLSKQAPWGNNISSSITNLGNYFITSDGRDLFDVLLKVLEDAERLKVCIEIESL
jgi:hypothetical protein